jgi:hypothetical protein
MSLATQHQAGRPDAAREPERADAAVRQRAVQGLRLVPGDGHPDGLPPLRLRPLAQPRPRPWSPPATHGPDAGHGPARFDGAGRAPEQGTFVLHAVPPAPSEPSFADPAPTPAEHLPCPDQLARRLVQAAVDVVRGHRPASQVLRWTTPEVYSELRQRARLEQAGGTPAGRRPVVRSLRTHPAGPTGIEVSAVVLDGRRARAVAARLDGEDSRWRLTALVIG